MAHNDNASFETADDNVIQSFQLEATSLRGRTVRVGDILSDILESHQYPEAVAQLVAETATLALLLSSMLKYEGIFTLQAKGDGPVSMLVADVTTGGDVRACAAFNEDALKAMKPKVQPIRATEGSENYLAQYLGKGYIAFTVDQPGSTERYQGIVELQGTSLVDSVRHYFNQSEQIGTSIRMAVGKRQGRWRSGGIMLQRMPLNGQSAEALEEAEEGWRRSLALMNSAKDNEMLDPDLHSNELLIRLFHEEGVRVYAPVPIHKNCRCSPEKVEGALATLSDDDFQEIIKDGKIEVKCEFCSRDFIFDPDELKAKISAMNAARNS